ncbi:MAG TPA: DUF257 family protein [Thermococcaceae archaeon]|uniref:Uncharacterized protein n=1 Tax=Thermococcus sibiricus (strain DSM 12597 / MM 739) TaxID=604354 RepID=C6A111_THESM|nr:DUF257 family protein [Thermococcus sibiricus]ACS89306.1 hypothetical protein TSIB_0239 [Thermococcus sibiricus MM 739]HII67625.1 DUF257 family protein [Thermococcaceae archaeon]
MKLKLREFLNDIREGERIFIEYESTTHPELFLDGLVKWSNEEGIPILIIDMLDIFHLFVQQLRFLGYKTHHLENLCVIKGGGRVEFGKVIGRVRIMEEFYVQLKEYTDAVRLFFEKAKSDKAVIVFLGTEKFLYSFQESSYRVEEYFEKIVRSPLFEGNMIFVFALKGLMGAQVRALWYESSTRVLEINGRGDRFFIKKAPKLDHLDGVIEL